MEGSQDETPPAPGTPASPTPPASSDPGGSQKSPTSQPSSPKAKKAASSYADRQTLFFAKVPRTASEEDIIALFSKYGDVGNVNLFRAFLGAPTSKGCGLLKMGSQNEASAAIDGLDDQHTWPGMTTPMVVKWMDGDLQRQRRERYQASIRQAKAARSKAASLSQLVPLQVLLGPGALGAPPHGGRTKPPPGCAPDAIKLFVGNIPKQLAEAQLLPFFETIGKVAELVVVRDRLTGASKGSAFVWYATRQSGERAILEFNMRHVLPDPSGEQDRPLVVRTADDWRQKALQDPLEAPYVLSLAGASVGPGLGPGHPGIPPSAQRVYQVAGHEDPGVQQVQYTQQYTQQYNPQYTQQYQQEEYVYAPATISFQQGQQGQYAQGQYAQGQGQYQGQYQQVVTQSPPLGRGTMYASPTKGGVPGMAALTMDAAALSLSDGSGMGYPSGQVMGRQQLATGQPGGMMVQQQMLQGGQGQGAGQQPMYMMLPSGQLVQVQQQQHQHQMQHYG